MSRQLEITQKRNKLNKQKNIKTYLKVSKQKVNKMATPGKNSTPKVDVKEVLKKKK